MLSLRANVRTCYLKLTIDNIFDTTHNFNHSQFTDVKSDFEIKMPYNGNINKISLISEEEVTVILSNCELNNTCTLETYTVRNASEKMLGFLADYWKLKVIINDNNEKKVMSFFIKAVSRTNASKANMVKELNLFEKELTYYSIIKNDFDTAGLKPWSAKFVTALNNDAIVFQDLNELQYSLRNKFYRFDMAHTLQALKALANFHASSIIFEENKRRELRRPYLLSEDFKIFLDVGGYKNCDAWFTQCKKGDLEAIRTFSEYGKDSHTIKMIESRWDDVWSSALAVGSRSSKYRNVIAHRDLWNNNILFRYKNDGMTLEPDDCVLVDFQATSFQPPAGDVMQLLYCNLDPKFREENLAMFLNFYHQELRMILCNYGVCIDTIVTKEVFFKSAEEHRIWGAVTNACLIPSFWLDDDLMTKTFNNSNNFSEIMTKNKGAFIKKIMQANPDYRNPVLAALDDIIERYCL